MEQLAFKFFCIVLVLGLGSALVCIFDFFANPLQVYSFLGRWTLFILTFGSSDKNRTDRMPTIIGFLLSCVILALIIIR